MILGMVIPLDSFPGIRLSTMPTDGTKAQWIVLTGRTHPVSPAGYYS